MQLKAKNFLVGIMTNTLLATPFLVLAQGGFNAPFANPKGIATGNDLLGSIITVITYFLALAAVTAVIFIILGGVKYITSQGESDAMEEGKKTVLYAVIGLIIIALAAVLVRWTTAIFPT